MDELGTHGEPPPDGGPVLFAAVFFAIPFAFVLFSLVSATSQNRSSAFGAVLPAVVTLLLGAPWVYVSRTRARVMVKSAALGALGLFVALMLLWGDTHIQGDDVMPLFFVMVGPFIVAGGMVVGALCGAAVLIAFEGRQHRRATWLASVRAHGHPRYRVVELQPQDAGKPAFLRFREPGAALCRLGEDPYRSDREVVALVPLHR